MLWAPYVVHTIWTKISTVDEQLEQTIYYGHRQRVNKLVNYFGELVRMYFKVEYYFDMNDFCAINQPIPWVIAAVSQARAICLSSKDFNDSYDRGVICKYIWKCNAWSDKQKNLSCIFFWKLILSIHFLFCFLGRCYFCIKILFALSSKEKSIEENCFILVSLPALQCNTFLLY